MNNDKEVDDILKEFDDEDMGGHTEGGDIDIDIESLLKGTETTTPRHDESTGTRSSKFDFNPNLEIKKKSTTLDKDIEDIINQHDEMYGNLDNIQVDEGRLNEILAMEGEHLSSAFSGKKEDEGVLPYKNPIEFINYMETIHIKKLLEGNENVFQLKNYKQHAKVKFIVLDFIKKSTLSSRFFKSGNPLITAIAAIDDVVVAGNNLGIIKMYSCEKELEFKSYALKEIENFDKRSVVCMDITPDGDYLIAGYSNGFLALWDLHTTKCKKLVTGVHKNCIVACKFIRNNKKKFELLSSDIDGNVFKVTIEEGFFSTNANSQYLIRHDVPIFLINILKLEDDKQFPEFNKYVIVAFGCLDYIMVFMLEPESKRMFKFERPKYFRDSYVPDVSFGVGYVPTSGLDNNSSFLTDSVMDQSYVQGQMNIDSGRPQVLLSIAWGRVLYLYCLPIKGNMMHSFSMVGHYINTAPIIRMGFLSNSIVFFFDKQKMVKVINTSLITPGEVRINPDSDTPIPYVDSMRKPELEEGCIVDPDLNFQTYIIDKAENALKATYNNVIVNLSKNIYVLGKKDFYHGKLLNWEQCLNNLHQKSEWMDALTLGLDIYHGRTTALADIPLDQYIRKQKVGYFLRNLIHQYAIIHTGNNQSILCNDKTFQDRLNKCINICIEFCLEIDAVDFLLTNLQPIFDSKGYGDEFIQKLEPFILCDKIINQELQQTTISTIIELYKKNKKFNVLSQILIHLDIQSIDIDYVKSICNEYNLITPLIYLYTNGVDEDYFYPIKKIFEIFEKSKEIKHFVSYTDSLKKNISLADLENSRQYVGHKLLWYIHLCLFGKKMPTGNIPETKFKPLVVKIVLWILSETVLVKLLNFDANSFFVVMLKIFSDDKIKSILNSKDLDSFTEHSTKLLDLKVLSILELLISKCKELGKATILQEMYEFIAKVSTLQDIDLSKNIILETCKYLLSTSRTADEKSITNYTKYIETTSNTIIDMIDSRTDLDKNDYYQLQSASELSPFIMVKIHLLKKNKSYKRCLEVFLQPENHIMEKDVKLFDWINETFHELFEEDYVNFDALKEEVLNKLHVLADISIHNVTILVENWFKNEQSEVVHKLDNVEHLQLKYVENVIEKFKDDVDYTVDDKKTEEYMELLILHIKLLCKLSPSTVLHSLQKRSSYPVEECLKKCLDYKVYDAAIYLMQTTGDIKGALNLSISTMQNYFDNLVNNLTSSNFKESTHTLLISDLKNNLKQAFGICENNADRVGEMECKEMWFAILEQLYSQSSVVKDKHVDTRKNYYDDLQKRLSSDIKETLEKMCSYVPIEAIITNVTEKYKEAEFKEFKNLLLNTLLSNSHLKNILISAKNLLANSILYNVIELKKLNQKGCKYNLYKCDQCSRLFNHINDEPIYVFGCGHKCHPNCAVKIGDEYNCNICIKNEIENSVTNPGIRSLIQRVSLFI
jgi:WD40 repeat protein